MMKRLAILITGVVLCVLPAFASETQGNVWLEPQATCNANPYYPDTTVTASYSLIIHWKAPPEPVCSYAVVIDGVTYGTANNTTFSMLLGGTGGGYSGANPAEARQKWLDAMNAYIASHVNNRTYTVIGQRNCYNLPPIVIGSASINTQGAADLTRQADKSEVTAVAEPINVANGEMFTTKTDISIPAKEIPLELTRHYSSFDTLSGQFGYGWRSNYDVTLFQEVDQTVTEINAEGTHTIYSRDTYGDYHPSPGKFSKLIKNVDATFTLTDKHGIKKHFDERGRLIRIEGRNGNAVTVTRNDNGTITEVTDSSGRKLIFTNDTSGKVIQIRDPANRLFKYDYSNNGDLIRVTDAANSVTSYQYDSNHKLTCVTDKNGNNLYFEYDTLGRAHHSWQDGNLNEVSLTFDSANRTTTVANSRNNPTVYEYNEYGLVTREIDCLNGALLTNWDAGMNKTSLTDQNGRTWTYGYDTQGNLISSRDPSGNITAFVFEPVFNLVTSVTDALNQTTIYEYDSRGNLIRTTDAMGNAATSVYDEYGLLTSSTDTRGHTTRFTYDPAGNLISTTDALEHAAFFAYDPAGNCVQMTDARNNPTRFTFDAMNRLTRVTYPDNSSASYTYDGEGNRISSTDGLGQTSRYEYTLDGKISRTLDALNHAVSYSYDTEGNLLKVTDQNFHETTYTYDALNRLVSETNPLGIQKTYTYDAAGNRLSAIDGNGHCVNYAYDQLNRPATVTYADGSSVHFTYDAIGRRSSMHDNQGTTTYSYDALGRLIVIDGPGENDTLNYAYDPAGNRATMLLPDGRPVLYAYDELNRLSSVTDSAGKTTLFSYDAAGNPESAVYPNNIQALYTFDSLNRLVRLVNQDRNTSQTVSEFNYMYDSAGRKTSMGTIDGTTNYSYDPLGQLTGEAKTSSNGAMFYQASYSYDPAGNRAAMTRNGTAYQYAYNDANQLVSEAQLETRTRSITVSGTIAETNGLRSLTVNGQEAAIEGETFLCQVNLMPGENTITVTAVDRAGNTSSKSVNITYNNQLKRTDYFYDNNGNLVRKQTLSQAEIFTYDYENRLIGAVGPGYNLTYAYDGLGKRISSQDAAAPTHYLYDGLDVLQERALGGVVTAEYLRNPLAAGGIGGIIRSQDGTGGTERYYSYDGLGSTANLSDSAGSVTSSASYDAFGNQLPPATLASCRQFLTKETGPSGLIYFGARYYDPSIGRFITPDPMGMIDGPNIYLYCLNDPVNCFDLYGLDTYYINNRFRSSTPTNNPISHSFVAITKINHETGREFVTDTFSWTDENEGSWHHNVPQDLLGAQNALDTSIGINWYAGEQLNEYINRQYVIRSTQVGRYNLVWNNCKEQARRLINDALRQQHLSYNTNNQQTNKTNCRK